MKASLNEDFNYVVEETITAHIEYFVTLVVSGIPEEECDEGTVMLYDANTEEKLITEPSKISNCITTIVLNDTKATKITAVAEIPGYFTDNVTFEVNPHYGNSEYVNAYPIVDPLFAIPKIYHMMMIMFNNTVDEHTFSNLESFTAVISEEKQVHPTKLMFIDDFLEG